MDEQNIPIDINTAKLLDWLISRRHVSKEWQNNILKVREKINNAIQDMPAHEGIIKLLSGQHINYFHCLRIVEILKETEKDSKNIFGIYGSQRMKDWQDIISTYQKDHIYLAEAAQIIIRNVSYEIPSLKKQVQKLEQTQAESEKKIKDYTKIENSTQKEFSSSCEQLGIKGKDIKPELLALLKDLPRMYDEQAEKVKIAKPAVELYSSFSNFFSKQNIDETILPTLNYLINNGNTTTYEFIYGEKPLKIEEVDYLEEPVQMNNDDIDFDSNIDFGAEIDFGDQIVIENPEVPEQNIDWDCSRESSNEESFEIVNYEDLNKEFEITLEESGVVVEKPGGIARGDEALTLLDNPKYRELIINDLMELESFLKMRLFEMSHDSDLLTLSQMQEAPAILQMQTIETITQLSDCVNVALCELTNKKMQHLHNIKHSPKYVDILTASLKQKLSVVERMKANKNALENKIKECGKEILKMQPIINIAIDKTKILQKEIQEDISKKYKGRIVNIVGGVNIL